MERQEESIAGVVVIEVDVLFLPKGGISMVLLHSLAAAALVGTAGLMLLLVVVAGLLE